MSKYLRIALFVLLAFTLLALLLVKPVDRTPYRQMAYYAEMDRRLDSLSKSRFVHPLGDLKTGYGCVSITPERPLSLAGYGARKPKTFSSLRDSVFIQTVVFDNGNDRLAVITADLLLFHPEVSGAFFRSIQDLGWKRQEIYLTASHTHSSIGEWAPKLAGEIISGPYDAERVDWLVARMVQSFILAMSDLQSSKIRLEQTRLPGHISNRLVDTARVDDWFSTLTVDQPVKTYCLHVFAAHPTCFSMHDHQLTADYPGDFKKAVQFLDTTRRQVPLFMAGAMASMGPPQWRELIGYEKSRRLGYEMALNWVMRAGVHSPAEARLDIESYRLKVPLRSPQFKVSKNIAVRSWLFHQLTGRYQVEISVAKIGNTLIMGFPGDFSGELALPLYQLARKKSVDLLITSFNGGYIGYITNDKWYDLPSYETRSMSWYGSDNGAYFTEIAIRLIEILAE